MTKTMGKGEAERTFEVRHAHGLHARPAGEFASLAGKFESEILVSNGEEWVSGRSILSLLSLAVEPGTMLRVRAVGGDAESALSELGRFLEGGQSLGSGS